MSARSPALPRAKAWRAGRRRMRDAACGAPAVSNYLADPICTIPEFAIGLHRCGVLSCPRGAPRDARVAGTPLRRPMTTASYGSLLSRDDRRTPSYRLRITAVSRHEIARYIRDDTMARMVIPVITMFILKIWAPYWM